MDLVETDLSNPALYDMISPDGPLMNNAFKIEAGNNNRVYLSNIGGECPKCNGVLKLRSIGPDGNKTNVVRCTRNPDHFWTFDPTVLDDL